jgi:hypothetical protein
LIITTSSKVSSEEAMDMFHHLPHRGHHPRSRTRGRAHKEEELKDIYLLGCDLLTALDNDILSTCRASCLFFRIQFDSVIDDLG